MKYGLLLISETQGIGKTTLMESILAPLVGEHNVSTPSEQQLVDSQFNSWIARKRLVAVNEVYTGQSKRAYNRVKGYVTDRVIRVNEKNRPEYDLTNWAHFVLASNSRKALHIAEEDRRWLVPELPEEIRPAEYWVGFHEWLKADGLSIILSWAHEFLRDGMAVGPGDRAPRSDAKDALIADSRSEGQQRIHDLGAAMHARKEANEKVLVLDSEVRSWNANAAQVEISSNKVESLLTIRNGLKRWGLFVSKQRFRVDGHNARAVANFAIDEGWTWKDIVQFKKKPDQLFLNDAI